MIPERYMYHSFPRRHGEEDCGKGLTILASLANSGLLLTPEIVPWPGEAMPGGAKGEPATAYQKRACFTELAPNELPLHAKSFGRFSLEFGIETVREFGAVPVFYVPVADSNVGLEALGVSFIARLTDMQELLTRLSTFAQFSEHVVNTGAGAQSAVGAKYDPATGDLLLLTEEAGPEIRLPKSLIEKTQRVSPGFVRPVIPEAGVPLGSTAGGMLSLLRFLTWGIQSFEIQLNSLRAMCGLFYPTERLGRDDPLTYYRQREWRVLANMMKDGVVATATPSVEEAAALLALDEEFFGREIDMPTGKCRRVDACQFFRSLNDKSLMSYVRRVICPESAVEEARKVLGRFGHEAIEVVPIESLNAVENN